MSVQAFQVGKVYSVRSICDYECVFSFEVTRRTESFVWLKNSGGKVTRRKVRVWDGAEACDPHGRYSMSPVLCAK